MRYVLPYLLRFTMRQMCVEEASAGDAVDTTGNLEVTLFSFQCGVWQDEILQKRREKLFTSRGGRHAMVFLQMCNCMEAIWAKDASQLMVYE